MLGVANPLPRFELTKITCSKSVLCVSTRSGTQNTAGKVPPRAGKVSACVSVDVRGIEVCPLVVQ